MKSNRTRRKLPPHKFQSVWYYKNKCIVCGKPPHKH